MTTLPDMAGTPRVVEIRGKEYKVSPLTIDDLAEFEVIVRQIRNEEIRKEFKKSEISEELIAEKIVEYASKPVSWDNVQSAMNSMTGTRYILWQALKKHQPNLKLEDMGSLIGLDNFKEVTKIRNELGGGANERKNIPRGKK